jgi:ABC-type uncharacterized transport system auxiliary subunit
MLASRFAAAAFIALLCGCADGDDRETPGDKYEWSIRQKVDLQYRGQIPHATGCLKVDDYDLLAVPRRDNSTRI